MGNKKHWMIAGVVALIIVLAGVIVLLKQKPIKNDSGTKQTTNKEYSIEKEKSGFS